MTLEQKIEYCKEEIEYRAHYMCLDFDVEDIEHVTLPDESVVVALKKIRAPVMVTAKDDSQDDAEKSIEYEIGKIPIIYLAYPYEGQWKHEKPRSWDVQARLFLPQLVIKFPQLVYFISPDGKIHHSEAPAMLGRFSQGELIEHTIAAVEHSKKVIAALTKRAIDLEPPE